MYTDPAQHRARSTHNLYQRRSSYYIICCTGSFDIFSFFRKSGVECLPCVAALCKNSKFQCLMRLSNWIETHSGWMLGVPSKQNFIKSEENNQKWVLQEPVWRLSRVTCHAAPIHHQPCKHVENSAELRQGTFLLVMDHPTQIFLEKYISLFVCFCFVTSLCICLHLQ